MRELIIFYLPWLLSGITIYVLLQVGNKVRWIWAVSLFNQALWLTWIIASQSWGLLPMNLALWVVNVRNHLKWMRT